MNTHTHILLLEDDESLRRSIAFKLSKEGFTVHEAPDLKTGKSLYPEHPISLVICDINLPDGNGLDFCAEIRQKSDILILFLTALDAETDMIKSYAGRRHPPCFPKDRIIFMQALNYPSAGNKRRAVNCSPAMDMKKLISLIKVLFTVKSFLFFFSIFIIFSFYLCLWKAYYFTLPESNRRHRKPCSIYWTMQ